MRQHGAHHLIDLNEGQLNEGQLTAVKYGVDDGRPPTPLLIIAGAGTGKTKTLAHRVAHLVLKGAEPQRILLLTFTRRSGRVDTTRRIDPWEGVPQTSKTCGRCRRRRYQLVWDISRNCEQIASASRIRYWSRFLLHRSGPVRLSRPHEFWSE